MAALVQTIAVLDRSGNAISTSKHLVNVFKEAKAAYHERKAEVVADRHHKVEDRKAHKELRAAIGHDNRPAADSRKHSRSHHSSRRSSTSHKHPEGRHRSDASTTPPPLRNHLSQELRSPHVPTFPRQELTRRHSGQDDINVPRPTRLLLRSMTSPASPTSTIDMDLAYGPIPPPLPAANQTDDAEFKGLVNKVKGLLEEADCLQYSVTATIASLQKNPDAMAAVALTLAEISNIITKTAPGVLASMKVSAPAVFALLASPQFLIAGGVAVGVTIVALGGYKIIKKIGAKNAVGEPGMDEMLEIGDFSMIDNWRRGIAEVEEQSVGTSVDGEFITPEAFTLSTLNLDDQSASGTGRKDVGSGRRRSSRSAGASDKSSSHTGSKRSSKRSSRGSSKESEHGGSKGSGKEKKVKKPSPLRLMFK